MAINPPVSVIVPSIRENLIDKTVLLIRENSGIDIEIILVSPSPSKFIDVWINEREPTGSIAATNLGFRYATGKYAFTFPDEAEPQPDFIKKLYDRAESLDQLCLLSPRIFPPNPFRYWGIPFSPLPFFLRCSRDDFFPTMYKNFYADPHLGLECHSRGWIVEVVQDSIVYLPNITDGIKQKRVATDLLNDRETFKKIWEPVYGAFEGDC